MPCRHRPRHRSRIVSAAPIWWVNEGWGGLYGYIGAGSEGLEFARHSYYCRPGYWCISVTGWAVAVANAVVDDFGNLVRVSP